jgi:bifunctional DNA-binding transcriptional regulator/antitoxin component of YhaV-PrlF toxin-antitoxin module
MSSKVTLRIGKDGSVAIPLELLRPFGLTEGSEVTVEETEQGLLIRPGASGFFEIYSPERRAEFLLSNAIDGDDYARARDEVRRMGVDPDAIPHYRT